MTPMTPTTTVENNLRVFKIFLSSFRFLKPIDAFSVFWHDFQKSITQTYYIRGVVTDDIGDFCSGNREIKSTCFLFQPLFFQFKDFTESLVILRLNLNVLAAS